MIIIHVMSHLRGGGILNRQTDMAVIETASCIIISKFLLGHFLSFSALVLVSVLIRKRKSSFKTDAVIIHQILIASKRKFFPMISFQESIITFKMDK